MESSPHDSTPHTHSRPRSVAIAAWLQIMQSLSLLGLSLYLALDGDWLSVKGLPLAQFLPLALFDDMLSSLILVLLALLGILSAIALLQLRSWAWMVAISLQGLGLVAALVAYIRQQPNYIGMATGVILVFYLNQYEVQAAFQRQAPEARMAGYHPNEVDSVGHTSGGERGADE